MILTSAKTIFRAFFPALLVIFAVGDVAVAREPSAALSTELSEKTPAEKIFPDSTKGFVAIRNLKELGEAWEKTQIGTLLNDPVMEAFKQDMRSSLNKRMENSFGFTLDGIEKLPSGEVAAGMIAIPDQKPGYVFTMDVTDRRKETEDYLKGLSDKLVEGGIKKTTEKYKDSEIIIFSFPEQLRGAKPAAAITTAREKSANAVADVPQRKVFYSLRRDCLIVADQMHLLKLVMDRLEGEQKNALADREDFKIVMKRCMDDVEGKSNPLIRWYIEPLNYGESMRTLLNGPVVEKRRGKDSIFAVLKQQGFDAIQGIGGVVSIKAENKETVYRIFVHAQKPFKLAMKMLAFPDSVKFEPATWMPSDIARCTTLYIDPLAIFDNFGTLFDALVMQGEEGVWDDIVSGLKEDVNGPQIDLREEIIVHLGQRILSMSKYQLPITPQSECIVVAVELKEGKEQNMIDALKKLFENDPEMQSTKQGSYVLWHRIPDEDVIKPFSGPSGVPDLVPAIPTAGPARPAVDEKVEEDPVFPAGAVTVANGCLFVGTRQEYLMEILERLEDENEKLESVASAAEYREVDQIFAGMGLTDKPHFLQFFARSDETIRPTYELIREGKMPQSQTLAGILANALFTPESDEDVTVLRQQAIDGTNLPEFDKIKKYFGPTGIYGASEEDGYFFKGFVLEKRPEEKIKEELKDRDEEEKSVEKEEPKVDEESEKQSETESEEPKTEKPSLRLELKEEAEEKAESPAPVYMDEKINYFPKSDPPVKDEAKKEDDDAKADEKTEESEE